MKKVLNKSEIERDEKMLMEIIYHSVIEEMEKYDKKKSGRKDK